jgi:hypothetical protein
MQTQLQKGYKRKPEAKKNLLGQELNKSKQIIHKKQIIKWI